jgi:hypothetical protein
MKQISRPSNNESEVEAGGRWFKFERFRRIEKVEIVFSDITPLRSIK